ncbi:MAG TPA: hypothetical protein VJ044_14985 [Candidatus Hodarchaeales archaeon]|nr:hypothetical protein [Candidatus Hodarchaeales archaeon]
MKTKKIYLDESQQLERAHKNIAALLEVRANFASMANKLANIIIESHVRGYITENDLDEANDILNVVIPFLESD